MKDVKIQKKNTKPTKNQQIFNYVVWLISTSRNAIVVILCSTLAYYYEKNEGTAPFVLTGTVKAGMPEIKVPPFHTVLNNQTQTFNQMASDLGSSIVLVPIIAVLGNVAIAKAFGKSLRNTIMSCPLFYNLS